ncbi:putative membrane protein YhhN [Saonia flava]|uniref:Putative membrane protein YhhN n=1 Tax=Saonia flava TaxID=523696 RepID=A0A846QTC6_9FLAO|nr:lysoplasmalogenase [Saonia flava]NJB70477.1 putative membrane protein YhhN [Saonia flava]
MRRRQFTIFFSVVLFLELIGCIFSEYQSIRYITKPAITISLLSYLFMQQNMNPRIKKFLALGLFFSLLGDILLMFTDKSQLYFMLGLFSFLIAHIMYISAFYKKRIFQNKSITFFIIALAIYAGGVLYFIGPKLGALLPYVLAYMFVILLLGLVALLRRPISKPNSYQLFLIGAISFIFSDTLLAFNKFHSHFFMSAALIMLTYGLAQILILYAGITETD